MTENEGKLTQAKPDRAQVPVKLLLVTFLFVGISGALGYYAWNLRNDHLAMTGDFKAAQVAANQVEECKEALTNTGGKLTNCEAERDAQTARQKDFEGNLNATMAELDSLRKQRAETAKRLEAFRDLTTKFQKMIDSGKVDVVIRGGRMIVKLPAGVLFASGSAALSRDGELALMEVAIVLRQFKDRRYLIEGHTDNRPLEASASSGYRNNWELSTARAVTVTEFLIEAKMSAKNLVAAGHGEFDPVGDNNSAKGRQENRRIEIILQPNIEALKLPAPAKEAASPAKK